MLGKHWNEAGKKLSESLAQQSQEQQQEQTQETQEQTTLCICDTCEGRAWVTAFNCPIHGWKSN